MKRNSLICGWIVYCFVQTVKRLKILLVLLCALYAGHAFASGVVSSPSTSTTGTYTVSWTDPLNYQLFALRERVNGGIWLTIYSEGSATSFNRSNLPVGTYDYQVDYCELIYDDGKGEEVPECSSVSNISTTAVVLPPPSTPGAISGPSSASYDTSAGASYSLSWAASTGTVTAYELQEKINSGSWTTIQNTTSRSKSLSGKLAATYSYRVRACNGSSCSNFTETKIISVTANYSVTSPASVTADPFTVSWTAPTGDWFYLKQQKDGGGWSIIYEGDGLSTGVNVNGAGTYDYQVEYCTGSKTSHVCSEVSNIHTTIAIAPTQPGAFTGPANPQAVNTFTVGWGDASYETHFQLWRRKKNVDGTTWQAWDTSIPNPGANVTSYVDTVSGAGVYQWVVRGCSTIGCGSWRYSSEITVSLPHETTPPAIQTGSVAGSTPYSTGVTPHVSSKISIPVTTVPGVNGLAPSLTLNYNSEINFNQKDNNWESNIIGYGWRLDGLSVIKRCKQRVVGALPVEGGIVDAMCLDGQALELVSGDSNGDDIIDPDDYWTPGAELRTELESFTRIIVTGAINDVSFEVRTPDGLIRKYGTVPTSRISESGIEYIWALDEIRDRFNNVVSFTYHYDSASRQLYPLSIEYAGAEVNFYYAKRPTPYPTVTIGGKTITRSLYLHTIDTSYAGNPVRSYRLTYVDQNSEMHLSNVQDCGYSETGVLEGCMKPVSFTWAQAPGLSTYVITKIVDSLGADTQYTYSTAPIMTDVDVPPISVFSMFSDETDPTICISGTDCDDVARAFVTSVKSSNGSGGYNILEYAVKGPANGYYSAESRGFLGYQSVEIRNVQTGIYTYAFYSNQFPYIGVSAAVHQYDGNWLDSSPPNALKKTERTYKNIIMPDMTNGIQYYQTNDFPYMGVETKINYESDGTAYTQFGVTRSENSYVVNQLDRILTSKTQTRVVGKSATFTDGISVVNNIEKKVTILDSYESPNVSTWLVNLLKERLVSYSDVPGETGSKSVKTTFSRQLNTTVPYQITNFSGITDLENTLTFTYDALGNISNIARSGAGVTTQNTGFSLYQESRYPTRITNAEGHIIDLTIDNRFGAAKSETINMDTTSITFDAFGRVTGESYPNGRSITNSIIECSSCPVVGTHVAKLQMISTDNAGPDTRVYMDLLGRVIRSDSKGFDNINWSMVETRYDSLGRIQERSNPYFSGTPVFTTYQYDKRNRVTRETRPDTSYTTISYKYHTYAGGSLQIYPVNRVLTAGETIELQTSATFVNPLGQVILSGDYTGTSWIYTYMDYDHYGNLDWTRVTADNSTVTAMIYDAAGNKTSMTEPNTGTTTFVYDNFSRLDTQTDARGIKTKFVYDRLNRITQRTDDYLGTDQIANTWVYDPAGHDGALSFRGNTDGFEENYVYDSLSRVSVINTTITHDGQNESFSIGQTYDSVGRPGNTTFPSGFVRKLDYNAAGFNSQVQDGSSGQVLHNFTAVNAANQVLSETFLNGLTTTKTYDPNTNFLTAITTSSGRQDLDYVWRSNGILRKRTKNAALEETFDYDLFNRLITADTASTGRTLTFAYDNLGNLTEKTSSITADKDAALYVYGALASNAGPHAVSSLTIEGVSHTLSYDNAGNVIGITATTGERSFSYNSFNKPTYIRLGPEVTPEVEEWIAYGPDGVRYYRRSAYTQGTDSIVKRIFYLAGGAYEKIVISDGTHTDHFEKTRVTDAVAHRTVQLQGEIEKTLSLIYLHRDHLGSVDVITDGAGNIVANFAYDPFAGRRQAGWSGDITAAELNEIITQSQHRVSRGFTDHEHLDRVGIIHMNGRIYEPTIGRFLSADPIVQLPHYSQSYNRYSYTLNSPLSYTDPSGFEHGPFPMDKGCDNDPFLPDCQDSGGLWDSSWIWFDQQQSVLSCFYIGQCDSAELQFYLENYWKDGFRSPLLRANRINRVAAMDGTNQGDTIWFDFDSKLDQGIDADEQGFGISRNRPLDTGPWIIDTLPSVDIKSQFSRILIELGATIETREWVLQQEFRHTVIVQPQRIGVQDLKVIGARNIGPEKRRFKKWVPVGDPFKHIENRACLGFGYLCSPSVNPPPIE